MISTANSGVSSENRGSSVQNKNRKCVFQQTLKGAFDLRKQLWLHLGGRLAAGLHLEVTQVVDTCRLILRAAAVLKSPCPPLRDPAEWVQQRHCLTAASAPAASQWSPINNPPTYSSVSLSLCLSVSLPPLKLILSEFILPFFFSSMPLSHPRSRENLLSFPSLPSLNFLTLLLQVTHSPHPTPQHPLPCPKPLPPWPTSPSCGTNIFFFFSFSNLVHSLPTQVARPYEVRLLGGPTWHSGLIPFQPPGSYLSLRSGGEKRGKSSLGRINQYGFSPKDSGLCHIGNAPAAPDLQ